MRPSFLSKFGADHARHATNAAGDAGEATSSTSRFSQRSGVIGVLGDLAARARPSVVTYDRRLAQVPIRSQVASVTWRDDEELTRLAMLLDKLPRSRRGPAFYQVLKQIVGDTRRDRTLIYALSGLSFEVRPNPLAALASRIGSLPDPAARVGAFNGLLKAYAHVVDFNKDYPGSSLNLEELADLRVEVASAIADLPENARQQALNSLTAID